MEILAGLESTNESVLSHRLNDVLRVLTAFSVVLLPLTLIGTIFGMNVAFPGEASPVAFWIILAVMAVILRRDGCLLPPSRLALERLQIRRRSGARRS